MKAASKTVDPNKSARCFTIFQVRLHYREDAISESCEAARQTYQKIASELNPALLRPCSASSYGCFFAFSWPDGDIERVKLAAEIIETLWIYDDVIEALPHCEALQEHQNIDQVLGFTTLEKKPNLSVMKNMLAGVFESFAALMLLLDKKGALKALNDLKAYIRGYDSKSEPFNNIDDYIEFRGLNVGFGIMESFMKWSLDINLTDAELELTREFYRSSAHIMALTNDFYSWESERNSEEDGRKWNAVPIAMRQYCLSEEAARLFIKNMIIEREERARLIGVGLKLVGSETVGMYVEAVKMMLGGNSFWSSVCPRYNLGYV
ncbi:hypothetical protein TWF694_005498 [Orbilia ellipsospora]|uniref:Terpene synthase n=1 Tax=Orbilia ellipsospora TaxID=2528407 RepID=A0AAV9WTA0_9PEZI